MVQCVCFNYVVLEHYSDFQLPSWAEQQVKRSVEIKQLRYTQCQLAHNYLNLTRTASSTEASYSSHLVEYISFHHSGPYNREISIFKKHELLLKKTLELTARAHISYPLAPLTGISEDISSAYLKTTVPEGQGFYVDSK